MSVLHYPRINFKGIFRVNPCTANNDDVVPEVVVRDSNTLGASVKDMTDKEAIAFLTGMESFFNPTIKTNQDFIRGGWNPYGDHFCNFDDTFITSVIMPDATPVTDSAQDPVIGQPFKMLGSNTGDPMRRGEPVMVDMDPTGLVTTQVFIGGLQLGSGNPSNSILTANHNTRAYQDWLSFCGTITEDSNPYRGEQNFVGIGCVMQFVIPKEQLQWNTTFVSPGLAALQKEINANGTGVVVRFRCFEMQPGMTDEELYKTLNTGNGISNPALGFLIGTIGVHYPGEAETEPEGRKLTATLPGQPLSPVYWSTGPGKAVQRWPVHDGDPREFAGNVVLQVHQSPARISLDLVNAFPKYGYRDPSGPNKPDAGGFDASRQKAYLGNLHLELGNAGAAPVILPFDYGFSNYAAYEDFGGIVDIDCSAVSAGQLTAPATIIGDINGKVTYLVEPPLRVITDDRAIYFDPAAKTFTVKLKALQYGGPIKDPFQLFLTEYINIIQTNQTDPGKFPPGPDGTPQRPNQTTRKATTDDGLPRVGHPGTINIPVGSDDWFEIQLNYLDNKFGATVLAYQLSPDIDYGSVPGWSPATYSTIRIYEPDTFEDIINSGNIQWTDVYPIVLRYYNVLFPVMSNYIPLDQEASFTTPRNFPVLRERLNIPGMETFYSTINMPLTRSMSPGKVNLLRAFIEQASVNQGKT